MFEPINFGPLHLSISQIVYGVGIVGAGMLSFHRMLRGGVPPAVASQVQLAVLGGGTIGGYVLLVLIQLVESLCLTGTVVLAGWGITILGAVAGSGAAALLYLRWRRIPAGAVLDLGVVPAPLGLVAARFGCLMAGCCYGRPTDSWIGMDLPGAHGLWSVRYPTQLLSAAADMATFLVLLVAERYGTRRGRLAPGSLVWLFIAMHCLKRMLLEPLRASSPPVLGPVTVPQAICLAGLVVAVAAMCRVRREDRGSQPG